MFLELSVSILSAFPSYEQYLQIRWWSRLLFVVQSGTDCLQWTPGKMKCVIPEISYHNRDPVLSVDFQVWSPLGLYEVLFNYTKNPSHSLPKLASRPGWQPPVPTPTSWSGEWGRMRRRTTRATSSASQTWPGASVYIASMNCCSTPRPWWTLNNNLVSTQLN